MHLVIELIKAPNFFVLRIRVYNITSQKYINRIFHQKIDILLQVIEYA